ncbi:2-C-methyl-D-erythritol 4-phosphate cytidylyltransferase [Rhodoferax sp. 4810]|uniref:2-C-methyl-D-erythritol 4-phosphate cytidylyltransferase n=1 Tax=Thiospirillum jenense TaxID=1653858 RepID=A0A839H5K1_9GAMM|nr:2-C-methyl-D-erythritol 4-phosphate cytidylyltransferase [Thiospirillum jenense]MBB1072993.1 2-C-methyl-D-erythritol 4-phosphate cytidylyltransferase [Rhodoferax jenense]MBB1124941.1 2-C-methyl-D-erythritol 4-phosphate cytidylyltransferase [Thiospirillum jenense]
MNHAHSSIITPRLWALIPAAGVGRRFGATVPKQYLELGGRRVIDYVLEMFIFHPKLSGCVVALDRNDPYWNDGIYAAHPNIHRAIGGNERCHSVNNALATLTNDLGAQDDDWVLVHDAARPCLRRSDLDALIAVLTNEPVGVLLAVPVHDTVKQSQLTENEKIVRVATTVARSTLWRAYTPQVFRLGLLRQALNQALANNQLVTDDASAIELFGLSPRLVEGHADNIKITRPEDLPLAQFFLIQQGRLC